MDTGAGRGLGIRSWKNAGGQAVRTNWGACRRDKHPGHPRPDLSSRVHRRSPGPDLSAVTPPISRGRL